MSPAVTALISPAATALIGAGLGYAYYRLVGCSSGTCPITARWWTSALYGAVLGWMMGAR